MPRVLRWCLGFGLDGAQGYTGYSEFRTGREQCFRGCGVRFSRIDVNIYVLRLRVWDLKSTF